MDHENNQHEASFNGHNFIAGMRWTDIPTHPKNRDFIAAADTLNEPTKNPVGVFILSESKATAVVGLATLQNRVGSKNRVFSLAASLAKVAKDGIYVAAIDGIVWVVAISDGIVVPSTDVVVSDSSFVSSQVAFIHSMLPTLDVYTDGFSVDLPGVKAWSLSDSLDSRVPVQSLIKNGTPVVLGGVGGVALIALGILAYSHFSQPKEEIIQVGVSEEQRRAEYFAGLQSQLENVLPADRAWVVEAWSTIRSRYPVIRFGWTFEGAQCSPTECGMLFSTDTARPRSADGIARSLGAEQNFAIGDAGTTMRIPVVMPTSFVVFDQAAVEALPASSAIKTAWRHLVEMSSVRFPGITFDIEPTEGEPLQVVGSEGVPLTPDGVPAVIRGSMSISGTKLKDVPVAMRSVSIGGAVPASLVVAYGTGKTTKAWKMELTYVAKR